MARPPRYAAPGMPQHVIQRGNNRSPLFAADADYRFFRNCLKAACERYGCHVHAYVFMTNHVHLLMTPSRIGAIGDAMQSLGRRYVRYFNRTYRRTGTLWDGRYRATLVGTVRYLFACYRYVELNPVRAGLAGHPADYPWSSHRANTLGARDPLVTPHDAYQALGPDATSRRVAYRALSTAPLDDFTLDAIRDATNQGWVLGSKPIRDEIASLLQRRAEPATRGRRRRGKDENRL